MTKKRTNGDIYVKRTANRKWKYEWWEVEDDSLNSLVAPAEYAVYRYPDTEPLARIVKAQDGWRVVVETVDSKFGRAVSPIGVNGFTEVKEWSVKHFGKGTE